MADEKCPLCGETHRILITPRELTCMACDQTSDIDTTDELAELHAELAAIGSPRAREIARQAAEAMNEFLIALRRARSLWLHTGMITLSADTTPDLAPVWRIEWEGQAYDSGLDECLAKGAKWLNAACDAADWVEACEPACQEGKEGEHESEPTTSA